MTLKLTNQQAPTLWISDVARSTKSGPDEVLNFKPGVNVLVGAPNTGKTKWVQMIDYLFTGDKKPEEEFDADIAAKYHAIKATIVVGEDRWLVERSWSDSKLISKITVNGEIISMHAFSLKLLNSLGIPVLHFPQGNPYGSRTWPELGLRGLFRHMYRRQTFWSDLADRQFESEQHACILHFVGLAEVLFSDHYARMIELEKQIQQMQDRREHFVSMLQTVSQEILDKNESGDMTQESLIASIHRLGVEMEVIQEKRAAALNELLTAVAVHAPTGDTTLGRDATEALGRELIELQTKDTENAASLVRTEHRVAEIKNHRDLIAQELNRMLRATEAGSLLADLKITHCPACDRKIESPPAGLRECYVCKRTNDEEGETNIAKNRLEFERLQLSDELEETEELLSLLAKEATRLRADQTHTEEAIQRTKAKLRSVRVTAASILPPELTLLDQEIGRTQERISHVKRILTSLDTHDSIRQEIEKIQSELSEVKKTFSEQSKLLDFQTASDILSDGMNQYLQIVNEIKPNSWTASMVDFLLRQRDFDIRVGRANWRTKLGGTLSIIFLLAYHYTLMKLAGQAGRHFPGFCLLDFPAQLDGVTVSDSENFVLVPFVRLMTESSSPTRQLIAAGNSFAGLEGAHRVELNHVWK